MPSRPPRAGFQPRDYAYCGLIAAHSFKGDWRAALRVQERMRAAGLAPTVHVFNALIAACDRGHQYERAMGIAREMTRAGVQPNAVTQQVSAHPVPALRAGPELASVTSCYVGRWHAASAQGRPVLPWSLTIALEL